MLAARAMLMKADIMLLDEPTNHLDVKNVAWLEEYLTHLPDVTSMVVSHDSGFLDHVCTGIIHYENRKLKHYQVSTDGKPSLLCCASCPAGCRTGALICSWGCPLHAVLAVASEHLLECVRSCSSFSRSRIMLCMGVLGQP